MAQSPSITPRQIQVARTLLGWSRKRLARQSETSARAVSVRIQVEDPFCESSFDSLTAILDGAEALGFFRADGPVDVVFSDINMPGMDGVMLSRHIETEFPTVAVLLISGRPRPESVRAFIAKPFRQEALTAEIWKLTKAPQQALMEASA